MKPEIAAAMLTALLVAACVTDQKTRRIPNGLILTGLVAALGWQRLGAPGVWAFDAARPGAVGPAGGLIAFGAMLGAFFPLYVLRVVGAGDVKLLAVVAAFFGVSSSAWTQLFGLALAVLMAGGGLSLVRMSVVRNREAVLRNVRLVMTGLLSRAAGASGPRFDPRTDSADRMPYAFAILVGTVGYGLASWFGWTVSA